MQNTLLMYSSTIIPLVIYIAGLVVCLKGFRKTQRKLFKYAALFFGVRVLGSWSLPLHLFPGYPFGQSFLLISNYVNIGLMILTVITMGLLVWGLYWESEK